MDPGTRVEVRSRFEQQWARGFEIYEEISGDDEVHYRLKRRSDGSVLPALFHRDDIREERRKRETWWL